MGELSGEAMLDGETGIAPETFQSLKIGVWRVEQAYLKAMNDNAPETVLESLRSWGTTAAYMLSEQARKQEEQAMAMAQPMPAAPTELPQGSELVA